jgi:TetR/AcrR family transcriptional regulator
MTRRAPSATVRSTPKAVSRRSPRGESAAPANGDRKQAILEAAISEFSAKGFSGARVDAIARSAQANKQLIYYYFDSKIGLYEAVLGQLIERTSERMDVGDPHPSVSAAVTAHIDRLLGQRGVEWLRFWLWEALESRPPGQHREVERVKMWARWVSDFERAQEHGEISERFDATMLALALNSIIVTPYLTPTVTKLMTGLDPDDASFKRRQLALVRSLLESLAPSSASGEDVDAGL